MSLRPIKSITRPVQVMEGAGVPVNRVFGHNEVNMTDPFLMMDHFKAEDPNAVSPGFPWHPHRGIETITYMLNGQIKHEDSLGNTGVLGSGDIQWMTAGSGIIHQEMPVQGTANIGHGFQLWANLPSALKMTDPRYQDIPAVEIPEITEDDGTLARVIAGKFWGQKGPVTDIASDPSYLDIYIPPRSRRSIKIDLVQNAFAYVFEGKGKFRGASSAMPAATEYMTETGISDAIPSHPVENRNLVLFDSGDEIYVETEDQGMRFLLISGKALKEPVAWHGPIVMNTREELIQAFEEYERGTFIKHQNRSKT